MQDRDSTQTPAPSGLTPRNETPVWILDGDAFAADAARVLLARLGYQATVCLGTDTLIPAARRASAGIVLFDASGGDLGAFVRVLHDANPRVEVIATGVDASASRAIGWVRAGAFDVLLKPFAESELEKAIERAAGRATLSANRVETCSTELLGEMVGADPRLARALDLAQSASRVRSTVLIHGESGTGKSRLARAIHRASPRAAMPFVELACGSIPETLLESELFGHVTGAFTGAIADKQGRFLAANGGTLFLDEINSASPLMQLKLLRVLQEKKFEPVGSDQTIEVDVRVIVASNQPLERLVEDGRFRQDLYYRVNVLPIDLPALRERPRDIAVLAEHFLRAKSAELGRTILGFGSQALAAMQAYHWPGNVRELENAVERAAIVCEGVRIESEHLPERIRERPISEQHGPASAPSPQTMRLADAPATSGPDGRTLADAMRDPERAVLLAALTAHGWNRSRAAASLGINRTTLYRKMRELGLRAFGQAG